MFASRRAKPTNKSTGGTHGRSSRRLPLQAKLEIGQVNDPLEHEADRLAEKAIRAPAFVVPSDGTRHPISRRYSTSKEADDLLLQMKPTSAGPAPLREVPDSVHAVLRSPGQALDGQTRSFFEPRFGLDFSGVRVHTDSAAAGSAQDVSAMAYTVGQNVVFGSDRFAPRSPEGQKLLAHELAHVAQDARRQRSRAVRRLPDPGAPISELSLLDFVREDPPGFTDPELDAAYQEYRSKKDSSAEPAAWALFQTVGGPRERLVRLLGPDYAKGGRAGLARPPVDVSNPAAPSGFDALRQQQGLATLNANSGALTDRLGNLTYSEKDGLSISYSHYSILKGNVAEALARPILERELAEIRKSEPNAQLFLKPMAQLRVKVKDSTGAFHYVWTNALQFTDGIIAVVDGRRLRILRVAEVKSGSAGGAQAQEQVHRWIEAHSTDGLRILLSGFDQPFEYGGRGRAVEDLTRAPRLAITPRDAKFAGPTTGHGTTAPVVQHRLSVSTAEINYLADLQAQQLLLQSKARQLLNMAKDHPLQPRKLDSTLELQNQKTIAELEAQNKGLALVNGTLYRVSAGAAGRSIERLQARPLQLKQVPPSGATTRSTPVSSPGTSRLGEAHDHRLQRGRTRGANYTASAGTSAGPA